MEKRKPGHFKSSPIPKDYAKMVNEVLLANFDQGLKKLKKIRKGEPRFFVDGAVYLDEIVLSVSLRIGKELSATTVHGSVDFDPRASSPSVQDLLARCVDGIGAVFAPLLSGSDEELEALASETLSALEGVPFDWTHIDLDQAKVFVKIDKSNPELDRLADDWLDKNDPDRKAREAREQAETEKLFVTGEEAKAKVTGKRGGGSIH
jgi:hypothetical protein